MGRHRTDERTDDTPDTSELHIVKASGRELREVQSRMSILRDAMGVDIEWEPLDSETLYFSVRGDENSRRFAISYLRRIASF